MKQCRHLLLYVSFLLSLLIIPCGGCTSSTIAQEQSAVHTVILKSDAIHTVKIVDQQHQRVIQVTWDNTELGKLEATSLEAELIRFPDRNPSPMRGDVPLSVTVTQERKVSQIPKGAEIGRIRQILVKDAKGFFVNPTSNGKYYLKPGEQVKLDIKYEGGNLSSVTVDYLPKYGQMIGDTVYIAPNTPGGTDLIKVKVWNAKTGALLDMDVIEIQIVV